MEIKNTSDEVRKKHEHKTWLQKTTQDEPVAKESKQTPKGELSLTLNKAYKSPTKEQQRFEVKHLDMFKRNSLILKPQSKISSPGKNARGLPRKTHGANEAGYNLSSIFSFEIFGNVWMKLVIILEIAILNKTGAEQEDYPVCHSQWNHKVLCKVN